MSDSGKEALERLYRAVLRLASDVGRIEDRLALVYGKYLERLDPGSLPQEMQLEFLELRARLEATCAAGDTASVDRDSAAALAINIILLYDRLARNPMFVSPVIAGDNEHAAPGT